MLMSQTLNPTLRDIALLFAVNKQITFDHVQTRPLSESQETHLIGFQKEKQLMNINSYWIKNNK